MNSNGWSPDLFAAFFYDFYFVSAGLDAACGARRMAETAALLSDEVFPNMPLRQWVISFLFPLRYLFAAHPQAIGKVLGIIYRAISRHLIHKAGYRLNDGATGAVTLIQRFGSALNLDIHFHILLLGGVYVYRDTRTLDFSPSKRRIKQRKAHEALALQCDRGRSGWQPIGTLAPNNHLQTRPRA